MPIKPFKLKLSERDSELCSIINDMCSAHHDVERIWTAASHFHVLNLSLWNSYYSGQKKNVLAVQEAWWTSESYQTTLRRSRFSSWDEGKAHDAAARVQGTNSVCDRSSAWCNLNTSQLRTWETLTSLETACFCSAAREQSEEAYLEDCSKEIQKT